MYKHRTTESWKKIFMDFIVVEMDQYNAQKEAGTET